MSEEQRTLFEIKESGFVSPEQRQIAEENPFFGIFSEVSIEGLIPNGKSIGKTHYWMNDHPVLKAFWTAQTMALEKSLSERDERFLRPAEGTFQIAGADGLLQDIRYEFEPDYYGQKKARLTPPRPRFQFFSKEPSIISESGYRHHPMDCIPFSVGSLEELIVSAVREITRNDDCEIFFF